MLVITSEGHGSVLDSKTTVPVVAGRKRISVRN
jgi:hypothetical protein